MGVGIVSADPTCATCNDGYIIAGAYGGLAPYSYMWTNGVSGGFNFNLSFGTYTVFAFDNAGNRASATMFEPATPVTGCTDPSTTNYDPTATVDDGTCIYIQLPVAHHLLLVYQ